MESAACRRRASDAEQSAWAYSMIEKCEPVKEEPEWDECGVSEAAVAEGLYAGHEVKDEVVIGIEMVQKQDVTFSMQNALNRMEEGLCIPKAEGGADAAPACTHSCPGDGLLCNRSIEQQYGLRSCVVRLERLSVGDLHRSKPCNIMQADPSAGALCRSREQDQTCSSNLPIQLASHQQSVINRTEDPCKLKPAGGAGAASECTHTRPGEGPRCNMSHKQELKLRSNTCLIIFDYKLSLRQTHEDEKPFSCEVCKSQFTKKCHLARHRRTHTGEKPFSCDVCKSQFADKSSLARHRRTHTGEKPFSCDVCKAQFTQRSNLARHRRTNLHRRETFYL